METIIDGHNLLFFAARKDSRFAVERGEPARDELLGLLSRYQVVTGDRILCVFDGGATGAHLPRHAFGRGLQIYYSLPSSDADTEIKTLVSHHENARNVRVITGDNAIRVFVEGYGARVTGSREFLEEIDDTLTEDTIPPDEPIAKYEGPDEDEMEFWLGVFGEGDDDKPSSEGQG